MPHDDPPPHIGPLISKQAAGGLEATYRRLLDLGCRPLLPFLRCGKRDNLVAPVIVDATGIDEGAWGEIGGLEWFGPLLVVRKVADFDAAVRDAAETPYGLAASLIGGTRAMFETFAEGVGAGVVNWNRPTSGAAGVLPFGGLGDSGNHRPAGYFAADFCSDPVSSLEASELGSADPWHAAR
jgi:succinylglutamic semialdehyde dehydrogenase